MRPPLKGCRLKKSLFQGKGAPRLGAQPEIKPQGFDICALLTTLVTTELVTKAVWIIQIRIFKEEIFR